MRNKKAQSALEYLLTYGWAILIVIIVGASLYALGVFNPGTFTGKRVTGFTQFQVIDHKLDTEANLTLILGNRLGKTVTIKGINATYKTEECNLSISTTNMGPNTQVFASRDCNEGTGLRWSIPDPDLRTSYSIIIDVLYTDSDSGLDHLDSGTLFGAVESS